MAKLYFYYAAMNAGKSTTLLQSAHNYEERNMRTLLFTPKLDDRFGEEKLLQELVWTGNVKFLLLMMIYMFGLHMNIKGKKCLAYLLMNHSSLAQNKCFNCLWL